MANPFQVGDVVRWIGEETSGVSRGALADVVTPEAVGRRDRYNDGRYVYVRWRRDGVLHRTQMDGGYFPHDFTLERGSAWVDWELVNG